MSHPSIADQAAVETATAAVAPAVDAPRRTRRLSFLLKNATIASGLGSAEPATAVPPAKKFPMHRASSLPGSRGRRASLDPTQIGEFQPPADETTWHRSFVAPTKLPNREQELLQERTATYKIMMEYFQLRKLQIPEQDGHEASSVRLRSHEGGIGEGTGQGAGGRTNNPSESEHAPATVKRSLEFTLTGTLHGSLAQQISKLRTSSRRLLGTGRRQGTAATTDGASHRTSRLKKRLIRFVRRHLTHPILPESTVTQVREVVMALTICFQAAYLPLAAIYYPTGGDAHVQRINRFFEVVFLVDLGLTFNTAYYASGRELVVSRRAIAIKYLKGWFLLDAASSVPLEWIVHLSSKQTGSSATLARLVFGDALRSVRLVHWALLLGLVWTSRLLRVGRDFWAWLLYSRYSHLLRIMQMVLLVVLTAHYLACLWQLVTVHSGDTGSMGVTAAYATPMQKYAADLYYSVQLIQGQGGDARTMAQVVYSILAVLLGSMILAIVFGNVAMLVSNFNANSTSYQRKMEAVFATVTKLQLPRELRERIHQYYDHLWREYESLDGNIVGFSKELTHTLGLEVGLYKYMDLIMKVPFWRGCGADFVTHVVLSLTVRVYLPDDYVIRKGEVGDALFMINRGVCELQSPHGAGRADARSLGGAAHQGKGRYSTNPRGSNATTATTSFDEVALKVKSPYTVAVTSDATQRLHQGDAFGEMSLLANYKRASSVRAVTFVEMCVLTRDEFQRILVRYGDERRGVLKEIVAASIAKHELPFEYEPICARFAAAAAAQEGGDRHQPTHTLTADQAAALLAEKMDANCQDESIKFVVCRLDEALLQLNGKWEDTGVPAATAAASEPNVEALTAKVASLQTTVGALEAVVLRLEWMAIHTAGNRIGGGGAITGAGMMISSQTSHGKRRSKNTQLPPVVSRSGFSRTLPSIEKSASVLSATTVRESSLAHENAVVATAQVGVRDDVDRAGGVPVALAPPPKVAVTPVPSPDSAGNHAHRFVKRKNTGSASDLISSALTQVQRLQRRSSTGLTPQSAATTVPRASLLDQLWQTAPVAAPRDARCAVPS